MVQRQKWSQLDCAHRPPRSCGNARPEREYDSNMAFSFVYIYDGQTSGPKWSTVDGIYTYGTQ